MIISHKFKFIFVKTTKTAGTSIEAYLSPICGSDDVFTPIYPPSPRLEPRNYGGEPMGDVAQLSPNEFSEIVQKHQFRNHMGASAIRENVSPDIWDSYFKFCVERNPWDKVVSSYHMAQARSYSSLAFSNFLVSSALPRDVDKWYDRAKEEYLVDRVLRYETLEQNLSEVFGQLGIPFENGLTPREKSEYRNVKHPLGTYYRDADMVQRVADHFAVEISLLRYSYPEN